MRYSCRSRWRLEARAAQSGHSIAEIEVTLYRNNPGAIRSLVRGGDVHRDVYLSPELFDLEMERLWRRTWVYVGHDSQVPAGGRLLHHRDRAPAAHDVGRRTATVRVFYNRCAHKGAKIVSASVGQMPRECCAVPTTAGPTGWMARCAPCR